MILAVAVCPHPPMLVPGLGGVADELADLRECCDGAVGRLVATRPERVVVLGAGDLPGELGESAGGTLAPYGVAVHAGGSETSLPLGLTIGAWLLDRAGWAGARTYTTGMPSHHDRIALLVMADGSATRAIAAPGVRDARAQAFDAAIGEALGAGNGDALVGLDLELADRLLATGARPLTVLGAITKGTAITAHLRSDTAPFGVRYWVAEWTIAQ